MYYLFNEVIYLIAIVYALHKIVKLQFTKKIAILICILLALPSIYFLQTIPVATFLVETLIVIFVFYGEKLRVVLLAFVAVACVYTLLQLLVGVLGQIAKMDTLAVNIITSLLIVAIATIFDKISFFERLKFNKSAQIFALNAMINLLLITIIFVIIDIYFNAIPTLGMIVLLILIALFTVSSQVVTYQYVQNINKLDQNKLLFEIQKHTYENSLIKYKERLSFLHDVRAYVSSVNRLLNDGDTDGAIKLINDISGELKKNKMVYSHNQYINLIINDFETEFKNKSIDFSYNEVIIGEINADSMDIISLFYNIISNALEAAKNSDDKIIKINVKLSENILYVDIINSVPNNFNIDAVKMGETSKKEDKDLHGIGLLNLNKIIKKYSGNMEFFKESGMFKLEIFILN